MKTHQPSLLTSLLHSATRCLRGAGDAARVGLRGANVEVVGVRSTVAEDAEPSSDPRFVIDVLIRPAAADAVWEPSALTLRANESPEGGDLCSVIGTEILEDRRFRPAANRRCTGMRRVRLNVRVQAGLDRVRFGHGASLFGCIVLPEAGAIFA
jgi:hypothetical protein